MQLCFVVGELLQFQHNCLLIFLGLDQIGLSFGLALRLVHNIFGFGLDAAVGILDEIFVSLETTFYSWIGHASRGEGGPPPKKNKKIRDGRPAGDKSSGCGQQKTMQNHAKQEF